jgi:hypothetical protein
VFLANNIKEDVCDFKVEGKMSESSCDVYAGQSSSTVAKVGLSFCSFIYLFLGSINLDMSTCNERKDTNVEK